MTAPPTKVEAHREERRRLLRQLHKQAQTRADMNRPIDDVNTEALEAYEFLKEMELKDRPKLDEMRFVQVFLPFFANIPMEQRRYPQVTLETWLAIAGNPYQCVDIVSNDDPNEVLYTVPALYDRHAVKPVSGREAGVYIQDVVQNIEKLNSFRGGSGVREYFMSQMKSRAEAMASIEGLEEHVRTWNAIFTRYGLPPLFDLGETPEGETPTTTKPIVEDDPDAWETW